MSVPPIKPVPQETIDYYARDRKTYEKPPEPKKPEPQVNK